MIPIDVCISKSTFSHLFQESHGFDVLPSTYENEIENCLYYARSIGDRDIINEMERLNRQVDNLQY